jgi:ring-1,2-phenylacetyl-CoA epoxidase subunit PaaA
VKTRTNEDQRQEFLDRYVPKILELGFTITTPTPYYDEASGHWLINDDDIDWEPLEAIKKNEGPVTARRLGRRKEMYDSHSWVRDAMSEPALA